MISGVEAIRVRINNYLQDEAEDIVRETISEVGIKRQTGNLLNSVKYLGEVSSGHWQILVGSEYTSYLNRGYASFDMKPGLLGKTVPIQTDSGLIFRKVGPNSKGWIHPGYEGKYFLELAEKKLYEGILKIVENNFNELNPEEY